MMMLARLFSGLIGVLFIVDSYNKIISITTISFNLYQAFTTLGSVLMALFFLFVAFKGRAPFAILIK